MTEDLDRVIASADRLGIELDQAAAQAWLDAIEAAGAGAQVVIDEESGVFGHAVSMLDFSPADLAYFRRVGDLVGLPDLEDVETALALSGSAAQSKVQTYPGDCDYFERVNIKANSRDAACRKLAEVVRNKALATMEGDTYQLIEVRFGEYPEDLAVADELHKAGTSVAWLPEQVKAGVVTGKTADGADRTIRWIDVAAEPGWCKLDWVVADPTRRQVANASNMLDVTWEAPDGSITPLDGYLDPYFQEIYLEAESIPLFTKLSSHVSSDALAEYVLQLEGEVRKYVSKDPRNYGKAAKRMYNIFRLNGRYAEAAYLRELFDEPTALLYQVGAVIRSIEEASAPGSDIELPAVMAQLDDLIVSVVRVLEGPEEEELVESLLHLRGALGSEPDATSSLVAGARLRLSNLVNNFFYDKLTGMKEIAEYMESVSG